MNEQLLKTPGADVLASRKKLRKTSQGGGIHPLVRPRVNIIFTFFKIKIKTPGKKQCYKSLEKGEPENNEISTLVSYTYTLQVFRFSTLYYRPCCIKK